MSDLLPEEIYVDKDYPDTLDNRFSLKNKEHRICYTRTPASNPVEEVSLKALNWMFKDVPVGGEAAFLMDNFKNGLKITEGKS